MTVYRKISGSWQATTQYQKVSGSWERATWYLKVNGSWEPVSNVVVDNFEDGDDSGWTVDSGSPSVVSGGLDGTDFAWQHDGFVEAHLAGADAVDRGLQPGDVWQIWFQIESDTGGEVIDRVEYSADGTSDADKYRIEWERNTSDTELSIEKISGGSQELLDTDENFVPSLGQTYYCEGGWNAGDNAHTAQMFTPDGSTASAQVSITDDSSSAGSDFQQPGIAIINSGNNSTLYDEARIIN